MRKEEYRSKQEAKKKQETNAIESDREEGKVTPSLVQTEQGGERGVEEVTRYDKVKIVDVSLLFLAWSLPVCLTVSFLANRSLLMSWLIKLGFEPKVKVSSGVSPPPGSAAPPPLPPSACSPHETLPINYFPPPANELTGWLPPTGNSVRDTPSSASGFPK